jgi:hypothetical protein
MIGTFALGFVMIPLVPIVYELSCELVFPIGEASAVGFLIGGSAISAFIYGTIFS